LILDRKQALQTWLSERFPKQEIHLDSLSGDAGFRCYYRFSYQQVSYLAVDAPPDKSNNVAFVEIAKLLFANNIVVPEIISSDLSLGFFCITDFGDRLLSDVLSSDTVIDYYQKAIDELLKITQIKVGSQDNLPNYDADFSLLELNIFTQWLVEKHLSIQLTPEELIELEKCFTVLVNNSETQMKVFMHRDYHSRNLMLTPDDVVAVIDFQDAVSGPITYDIVSLLRDCYIRWPQAIVTKLFDYFIDQISQQFNLSFSRAQWQRWFDLQGLQRHIKASGIFARLHHRDGKSGYLTDIPLTLSYIVDISEQYSELIYLHKFIKQQVQPKLHLLTQNK
jgi:aminoglycoside/choline kinase family phosphotransferase